MHSLVVSRTEPRYGLIVISYASWTITLPVVKSRLAKGNKKMKPLETSFPFNDDCDVLVVQKATRSAKYNDSSEQGHCFLLTNAEIEEFVEKLSTS